ncbi:unnamed protein product [Rangifer tarandus platyrhynchus]|uniref:Uncharacterized protein n=2 Tax=Rangifer tarandus platyrhynchus TaxID=3082113 RepID=A0AC59YWG0_RANTA|nr:unnamed protein product [Rangifer tarandus platyrhynchus]
MGQLGVRIWAPPCRVGLLGFSHSQAERGWPLECQPGWYWVPSPCDRSSQRRETPSISGRERDRGSGRLSWLQKAQPQSGVGAPGDVTAPSSCVGPTRPSGVCVKCLRCSRSADHFLLGQRDFHHLLPGAVCSMMKPRKENFLQQLQDICPF